MPDISLDKASFVSLWVETLLYGAYAVLFSLCVYVLLYSHRPGNGVNKPLLLTAVVMFTLSSVHVYVGLARGIAAFFESQNIPGGALGYYAEIWLGVSIFKQALYATNNIVADGLVIYRCYIVWGFSKKIVIVPIIMLIATTVCAYLAVFNFSQVVPGQNVFASNIAEWGTALFSLSLATNIIVTSLIAGRIWWISHKAQTMFGKSHGRKYKGAFIIILESGAIYSVSLMTLLILYCSKSNAQYIVYDALAQIMGIVPTLIIVRVGLGLSTQDMTTFASTTVFKAQTDNSRGNTIPMQIRKAVHVEEDIETGSSYAQSDKLHSLSPDSQDVSSYQ